MTPTRWARWRATAAFAVASSVLAVVQAQPAAGNTLKIGVIGPFTGPSANFGVPLRNGIQQAVDEINAVGGYLGRKLEIVAKDDEGTPAVGLQRSQALVAEKVIATIGFCNANRAGRPGGRSRAG